ncbi:MAG: protein kinase domain-containing protein [Vicinamibacterales bacterium]
MTPERWRRIEDLFHAAREHAPGDRDTFLAASCAGDDTLRQEVQSLLTQRDGTLLRDGHIDATALLSPSSHESREGLALGPYVLGPLLGVGGMGEVYRARDTKLGRDVAVKILPERLAQHAERLARFEREARILATLNHPNIAAIYGLEDSGGLRALVLELVEGITLADKLHERPRAKPALPLDEALPIARQIAEALEAAHDKGIVHRDLKPANIKITPSGVVKVLDFGIAKIRASESEGPTELSVLDTSEGAVLGTVAYMSPEQARGLPVDKRTDIWAFGCVVFEMVTGCRSFPGESSADVLGAITSAEPDGNLLPPRTPQRVRDLLRRCLTKDSARRLHDIADARIEIEDAIGDPQRAVQADPQPQITRGFLRLIPWMLSGVLAMLAAVAVWYAVLATTPEPRSPARLSIALPPDVSLFAIGRGSSVAVSPDGRRIVYAGIVGGRRQLYSRLLDGVESTPIAGTEGAANPIFSPDGRWIAFTTLPEGGSLKRIPVEGGAALIIVDNMGDGLRGFAVQGVAWGSDDTMVFGALNPRSRGLWRVAASGGTPESMSDQREDGTWPQILPGGTHVLYTRVKRGGFDVALRPLTGGEHAVVVEDASYGRVISPDGRRAWLVYARSEGLHGAPFDLKNLRVAGPHIPILDRVLNNLSGGAHFAVSQGGLLAYIPGGLDEMNKTLLWVGQDGTTQEIGRIPGVGFDYRLSPDGRRLARPDGTPGGNRDLFIDDLVERGTPRRLTDGTGASFPIWTPDGRHVIYSSWKDENLYWRAADRSDDEERLSTSANRQVPGSVSSDGRTLAYHEADARGTDIWLLPLDGPRQPRRFLDSPFAELNARFSPDGRWLAYQSNISGAFEIWVASVATGGQFPVSRGGGQWPLWSANGRELFYRNVPTTQGGDMMVVSIDPTGEKPKIGSPRVLFPSPYQGNGDIAPDGRFLLVKQTPLESPSRVLQLVLNWFDDLQAKVPLP